MAEDSGKAFLSLVAPHFDALYRAAMRLTRRPADAEDLVQEVCLRAYAEVEALRNLEFVLGWLLRVQYRVFVDVDRRRRRAPFAVGDDASDAILVCDEGDSIVIANKAAEKNMNYARAGVGIYYFEGKHS